jgi:hypothetical protein
MRWKSSNLRLSAEAFLVIRMEIQTLVRLYSNTQIRNSLDCSEKYKSGVVFAALLLGQSVEEVEVAEGAGLLSEQQLLEDQFFH